MSGVPSFLKHFVLHPGTTGAIAASCDSLAELITDCARLDSGVRSVVEFGPGTGVFTERILRKIAPDTTFFAMEISPYFVAATRKRCPEATIYEDSALNVKEYLRRHGVEHCDRIVCGLPWAAFPKTLQDSLMDVTLDALSPGGRFVTFAYLHGLLLPPGVRFRRNLTRSFRQVTLTRTVWRNAPPAFVYCADK